MCQKSDLKLHMTFFSLQLLKNFLHNMIKIVSEDPGQTVIIAIMQQRHFNVMMS